LGGAERKERGKLFSLEKIRVSQRAGTPTGCRVPIFCWGDKSGKKTKCSSVEKRRAAENQEAQNIQGEGLNVPSGGALF